MVFEVATHENPSKSQPLKNGHKSAAPSVKSSTAVKEVHDHEQIVSVPYNFGPGPARLPREVLIASQKDLINYAGTGLSILEISHRSKEFSALLSDTKMRLCEVMDIPSNYTILFLPGGATAQFSAVPMNLLGLNSSGKANYCVTGSWSKKAAKEAEKHIPEVHLVLRDQGKFTGLSDTEQWNYADDAAYTYFCSNETIEGVQFPDGLPPGVPENIPIVCDMSSDILSRRIDISKYGVIFGGTQKNVGAAGVTLVIIRNDLLQPSAAVQYCPSVLNYVQQAAANSILNTPPVFAIYTVNEVLKWIQAQGGVDVVEQNNRAKSSLIYDTIDKSDRFFGCPTLYGWRSQMNIPFRIGRDKSDGLWDESLEAKFLQLASERNFVGLKGHRSVGGMRASLYNAVSMTDCEALVELMQEFKEMNCH